MKIDYQDRILEVLFQKYNVTLEALFDYADAHHDEILDMDSIFNMETEEDARRFIVIPRLLDPKRADTIIALFREEEKAFAATQEPDIGQYALLLIAAFAYNPLFFKMAVEWCVLMGRKAAKHVRVVASPFCDNRSNLFTCSHRFEYKAASGAEPVPREFGTPFVLAEDVGTLKTLGVDPGKHRYLQFRFIPRPDCLIQPYELEVRFMTSKDKTSHTIRLRDPSGTATSIDSVLKDGKDIDYTQGIEIQSVNFHTLESGNHE